MTEDKRREMTEEKQKLIVSPVRKDSEDSLQLAFELQHSQSPKTEKFSNYHGNLATKDDILRRKDSLYHIRQQIEPTLQQKLEKTQSKIMFDKLARGKLL